MVLSTKLTLRYIFWQDCNRGDRPNSNFVHLMMFVPVHLFVMMELNYLLVVIERSLLVNYLIL